MALALRNDTEAGRPVPAGGLGLGSTPTRQNKTAQTNKEKNEETLAQPRNGTNEKRPLGSACGRKKLLQFFSGDAREAPPFRTH